jgi:hypothetical protein
MPSVEIAVTVVIGFRQRPLAQSQLESTQGNGR